MSKLRERSTLLHQMNTFFKKVPSGYVIVNNIHWHYKSSKYSGAGKTSYYVTKTLLSSKEELTKLLISHKANN